MYNAFIHPFNIYHGGNLRQLRKKLEQLGLYTHTLCKYIVKVRYALVCHEGHC